MSGLLDDVPCESFEGNTFAKSLCQHCCQVAGAHQHASQVSATVPPGGYECFSEGPLLGVGTHMPSEDHGVEAQGREAGSAAEPGGPWDTLCIVAPQCEVYVSVGPVDSTARWEGSWTYPLLSPRAEGEHRENSTKPSPDVQTCAEANSALPKDREMTRLWDSVLGSGKRDMMNCAGHKEEVRTRALQADRASNRFLPAPERGLKSQKPAESWARHRTESSYFSLERRTPEPRCASPRRPTASRSPSPARSEPPRAAGRLAALASSPPREAGGGGGMEGRRGMERQEYTALAGLPKARRLSRGEAWDRSGSRTLSPGRAEVQRMFGCERRKSETLEAFQALEEGRVDRLDGKTPVPPSKGPLARRQSSPTLFREGQRLFRQLEQHSRDPKGSLRSLSPARQLERNSKSRGDLLRPVSPTARPERDWRRPREPASPARQLERDGSSLRSTSPARRPDRRSGQARSPPQRAQQDWRSRAEPVRPTSLEKPAERDRAAWQTGSPGKQLERKSRGDSLHSVNLGRSLDNGMPGRAGPLRSVSPGRRAESTWKSQKEIAAASLVRSTEGQWMNSGELLHAGGPGRLPECGWQVLREKLQPSSLGKGADSDQKGRGKPLRPSQLGGGTFPPPSSASASGSQQPYVKASEKHHKPDLLNFKKGWMSILDEPGEWKKHWFVLTDSSLRYYRDSNAEEADDLDGEIDLRSCTDVTEFAVQRNYGFQIHTKDAVFTLSAMTSGIRRNWIEALRKNVRPVSAPDVTKLSDCNKENSFQNYVPQKGSLRTEEQQRPGSGSEVISKGSPWKADGQRHAFDYVELSPLQQGPVNQGSPQRTRGSLRVSDRTPKHDDLERDQAIRSEERRKWFEGPDGAVPHSDGSVGDSSRKLGEQDIPPCPLSEDQRIRLSEEIEKKWLELERLPLKDSRRVPLTTLLNQSKGSHGETNEALKKEVQSLRAQLESCRARNESLRDAARSQGEGHVPRGYISQEACERSLAEMESSHQQVMEELQRHHQRELERLRQEKERLLAEEAAATAAAIEALKKAHREEMNKELGRTRSFQQGGAGAEALQKQHQLDVDSLKRELQVLSEQYSQKCLEIGQLTEKAEEREQTLQRCQQEGKELLRQNQELQSRLSEEIGKLRSFISSRGSGDRSAHNNERSSCELEVLLRVKENELQYLKKEIQCLREELQMMQKDKRFASGKYQDVYAELNHIKVRSEREIEQLKEHLRLAMAALQEKESLCNSISK
ncbi:TRIO and F-actin-binding protein [Eudromia elegans]